MYKYNYRIAQIGIEICSVIALNEGMLAHFRDYDCGRPDIRYRIVIGKINAVDTSCKVICDEYSGNAAVGRQEIDGVIVITVEEKYVPAFGYGLLMESLNLPDVFVRYGGVVFHSAFVAFDGEAILFTAQPDGGKTTQAMLWEKYLGAEIVNGDRALLKRKGDRIFAYGNPYCGMSEICGNKSYPLRAVIIVEKAENTSVEKCSASEAVAALCEGIPEEFTDIDIVCDIAENVPFYRLKCTLGDESVKIVCKELFEAKTLNIIP